MPTKKHFARTEPSQKAKRQLSLGLDSRGSLPPLPPGELDEINRELEELYQESVNALEVLIGNLKEKE